MDAPGSEIIRAHAFLPTITLARWGEKMRTRGPFHRIVGVTARSVARILNFVLVPDPLIGWLPRALPEATAIVRTRHITHILATAICAVIQVVVLLLTLSRKFPALRWGVVLRSTARSVMGTAVMAVALALFGWTGLSTAGPIWETGVLVVTGVGAYAIVARCLGARELSLILQRK